MKYLVILLIAFSLVGCKGEFVVKSKGEPYTQMGEESCTKCGICRYYDYKRDKYRTGASCDCDGRREVKYEITELVGYYEKEPNKMTTKDKKRRIKSGTCR